MGFIGSNLVRRLASLGARVGVVDSLALGCGGNRYNLDGLDVAVYECNISEVDEFARELDRADLVFNLAGEISHIHSMRFPERDAELNMVSQLAFLQECARRRPGLRVVYAGTRQIYGTPRYLPVDEQHPVQPTDFNGVHKYAAASYHMLFSAAGQMDAVVLNLTNVYGPRMGIENPCQGFLSNFVRRAVTGQAIEIYGDGRQLRDPVHVDDVVDLFLRAGAVGKPAARQYNVGGAEVLSVGEIARTVSEATGTPAPVFRPFPDEHKAIDIGSYSTDSTLVRQDFDWTPTIGFQTGMTSTISFFQRESIHYLDPNVPNPPCKLAGLGAPKTVPVR